MSLFCFVLLFCFFKMVSQVAQAGLKLRYIPEDGLELLVSTSELEGDRLTER